jgi:hypothetical protein
MGRRNFHGRVETLADAVEADYLVIVKCDRCAQSKQMHPYKLTSRHKQLVTARLDQLLPGFFCKTCRSPASVTITCTYRRSGEM